MFDLPGGWLGSNLDQARCRSAVRSTSISCSGRTGRQYVPRYLVPTGELVTNLAARSVQSSPDLSERDGALGHFCSVTERTLEGHAELGCSPRFFGDPWSKLERWTVTNVLVVATLEFCHPFGHFILVVGGDRSFHDDQRSCALVAGVGSSCPAPFFEVGLTRRNVSTRSA